MSRSSKRRASPESTRDLTHAMDLADGDPLANAPADPALVHSLAGMAELIRPLMGLPAPRDTTGRILDVRPKGHWFEFEVAKLLGYHYPPRAGFFPDIPHQLLELKHHTGKDVTIDFGRHHPGSKEVVDKIWNAKVQAPIHDIRYLIALSPPPEFKICTVVLATGAEIDRIFGVSPTKTIKYQMGISKKWRDANTGKIIVSGKALV